MLRRQLCSTHYCCLTSVVAPSSAASASVARLSASLRHIRSSRKASEDMMVNRVDHQNEEIAPGGFFDQSAPSLDELDISDMVVDKRGYGIPFKIDDEKAQDLACQHHGTAVEIKRVERLMVPFWLAATSAGGQFKAELLRQHPGTQQPIPTWDDAAPYNFSFPFEEHFVFNQIAASYDVPPLAAMETCCGKHVPSMLISRWELLEELDEMPNAPRLLNFSRSAQTAVKVLGQRFNRDLLARFAKKDLRKHYPNGWKFINLRLMGCIFEVMRMKPAFLPLYRLYCVTISHPDVELPTYVCGATGKTTGPVIHTQIRNKVGAAAAGAVVGFASTASIAGPIAGAVGAATGSYAAVLLRHIKASAAAKMRVEQHQGVAAKERMDWAESDEHGYKWRVEDEEKFEYEFREELREKARRRMRFEQRVQEEFEQDDAQAQHARKEKEYRGSKPRRQRRPGQHDKDPLGYYRVLGLQGKEGESSKTDIAKAFRREAQLNHPDVVSVEKQDDAKAKMQKIVEAYNVLRDVTLRKEYDSGALGTPVSKN